MMEMVMIAGAIRCAKTSQFVTNNKPTPSFFTDRIPFLLPNQLCQSTEESINIDMVLLLLHCF